MIFRSILAILLIAFQQGLIILFGVMFIRHSIIVGSVIFLLCLPMLWLNKMTWKYIRKYGTINFIAINSDTSEIDIEKGRRWYDKKTPK